MSELNFTITASNEEILRKLQEVRKAIENSGETATRTSREIESQIMRTSSAVNFLKDAFVAVGVPVGLSAFVKKVIDVRSEFQNTEAAFRVFLGSMEAAKDLMKELQTYAFHNVFEFKDLTQQAAQLLAFGTEVKDLTTVIDQLSNIAAAVNQPLERFVDLYNKAKSTNRLDAVDIKQWSVMGDMIQYFADSLGKSKGEIRSMVSAGSIGFKELEKVIASLTSEGGRFNGMMEEKMKTLGDSIGLLQDSITVMFNEIGEKSEDVLRGGILAVNSLVENYEKVGKALIQVIGAYGLYRAAVIVATAIDKQRIIFSKLVQEQILIEQAMRKGATAAMVQEAAATKALAITKQNLLASIKATANAMLPNPYMVVGAAVAALGVLIYNLTERIIGLNKIKSIHKEIEKSVSAEYEKSALRIGKLIGVIEDETKSQEERNNAIKNLKTIMPEYNGMLSEEGKLINHNKQEIDKYLVSLREKIELKKLESELDTLIEGRAEAKANSEKYAANQKNILRGLGLALTGPVGAYINVKEGVDSLFDSQDIKAYDKAIEGVMERMTELQKKQAETKDDGFVGEGEKEFVKISDEINNTTKKITGLKEEIAGLRSGKIQVEVGTDVAAEIERKVNELKNLEKNLETLTGISKDKGGAKDDTAERLAAIKDAQDRIKQQEIDFAFELRQLDIDLMEEGSEKIVKQIELDYDRRIDQISKKEAEMVRQRQELEKKETGKIATSSRDDLSKEQQGQLKQAEDYAKKQRVTAEEQITKTLLEKYQGYAEQRIAIEEKFNNDIELLQKQRVKAEAEGNDEVVKQFDSAINKAVKDKGKELMTFDFNIFKESPEYVRAFEDLQKTSTETLNYLLEQLDAMKYQMAETLDPADLQEYANVMQRIYTELTSRDPFKALTKSQEKLSQASKRLAQAKRELAAARTTGDTEKEKDAELEMLDALDAVSEASYEVVEAQKKVNEQFLNLFDTISGLGSVIGGTAGEILSLIGDIGNFVLTTIEGVKVASTAGATALSTLEKASAILAIIQIVIQLVEKISSLMPDAHQQYMQYAAKVEEVNKLKQAVLDYEIAVQKAKHAEDSWFGRDSLRSLKQARDERERIDKAYFEKLYSMQATYQNKTGDGWLTKSAKNPEVQAMHGNTLFWFINKENQKKQTESIQQTTEAMRNLRIETREAKKGFLGSGIGGKSQKTEDLVVWAKREFNDDLFDEQGRLNTELADTILEKYGDKLVGQTKETLEELKKYQEMYDEYKEALQEYVSSLYEPLVDNFIDSLWDWFDEGKDALTSFKDYASNTFRAIVSDMMRTIVLKNIVDSYSDDMVALYDKYAAGIMTEEELMKQITDRTNVVIGNYERELPMLQNMMNSLNDMMAGIGIDMRKQEGGASDNSLSGAYAKASQESINLLAGQTGAVRVLLEDMLRLQREKGENAMIAYFAQFGDNLLYIRDLQAAGWKEVTAIRELSSQVADNTRQLNILTQGISDSNAAIQINTGKTASELNEMNVKGMKVAV